MYGSNRHMHVCKSAVILCKGPVRKNKLLMVGNVIYNIVSHYFLSVIGS